MYSKETLKKYMDQSQDMIRHYNAVALDAIAFCISEGNDKIGRTWNVSTLAIYTCGNCKECKDFCYDIKACVKNAADVLDARVRNTVILWRDRDLFFTLINNFLNTRRKHKFFRWHVAGEIVDYDYFCRMVETCREHPDWTFWTYTKMYHIVNKYCDNHGGRAAIPSNFSIMFSPWDGLPMDNPYNFPVFAVRLKAGNKTPWPWEKMYKCPGNCDICKAAGRGCIVGEDTYNDEH